MDYKGLFYSFNSRFESKNQKSDFRTHVIGIGNHKIYDSKFMVFENIVFDLTISYQNLNIKSLSDESFYMSFFF